MFTIVFVDDERRILDGLRRMLSHLDGEWRMRFVESGREALRLMEGIAVDVIVSDARMPDMNGPTLLAEVLKRHPATVRLVLSGFTDQSLILEMTGVAHQFLNKPCDAETIESTLRRLASATAALLDPALRRIAGAGHCLGSQRSSRDALSAVLDDPDVSLRSIADIVRRDAAMAARILHLVNSAFFGVRRCVGAPDDAVRLIGLERLRKLANSAAAFPCLALGSDPGIDLARASRHGHAVATLAKAIAEAEAMPRTFVDQAYLCGQLHDIGTLMLAAEFGDRYRAVSARSAVGDSDHVERTAFGATHADFGAYLMALWGIEPCVVQAIASHHRPMPASDRVLSLETVLHVADALVGESEEAGRSALDTDHLAAAGRSDRLPRWRDLQATAWTGTVRSG